MSTVTNNTMSTATKEEGELAKHLRNQRGRFFKDVRSGNGRGWTVVAGNQGGGEFALSNHCHGGLIVPQTSTLLHAPWLHPACLKDLATIMWFPSA
jgi:hypothetical protein